MNQPCACRSMSGIVLLASLWGLVLAAPVYAVQEAWQATPPPGKSLIFVFRADRAPLAGRVPVLVNTVLVGELANNTFIATTVAPGKNYLRIGDRAPNTLEAAAGQSLFVRVRAIGAPGSLRSEVDLVSEAEGRRLIEKSRFVGVDSGAPAATAPRPEPPPVAPTAAPPSRPPTPTPAAAQPSAARDVPAAAPPSAQPSQPVQPPVTQPTAARALPAATTSVRDWKVAIIANAGTFELANGNQVFNGIAGTYDTTSKTVYGIGVEWRSNAGFAVGGEVFHYENDLVLAGPIPGARQEVLAIMLNGKYYFRLTSSFYPFVGVGIGVADASYSGGLSGNATGLSYQGLAGIEYRFDHFGVHVQYKYLDATTGDSGKEVKVGGSGILAGVSIAF